MNAMKKNAYSLTVLSLCLAVALILSYVESLLPGLGVPGIKLGLPNIAVLFVLYRLGTGRAAAVSLTRVVLVSLLFGTFASFCYSLAGAGLSLGLMALLRRTGRFSPAGVSVAGGVAHNLGQAAMAAVLLGTGRILWYLPALLAGGVAAGLAVGLAGGLLLRAVEKALPPRQEKD